MEVILKQDVPHLGRIGEVVKVKNGYARNYLIPRSLAVAASTGQKRMLEHQKRVVEALKKKVKKESEEKADSFKSTKIKLKKRFNESGKMFGSIQASEIVTELEKQGHRFDRKDIELPNFKEAGDYKVKLRLPGDVFTEFTLEVEAQKVKTTKKAVKKEASKEASQSTSDDQAEGEALKEEAAKVDE